LSSGCRIYINTARYDNTDYEDNPGSFVSAENLTAPVRVGEYNGTFANGLIDNVRFWNKELTPLEVKYLYNGGAGVENIPTLIELSRTGQHFSSHQEM